MVHVGNVRRETTRRRGLLRPWIALQAQRELARSLESSEHGSTPSNRTSRGLGGSGAGPAAEGVPGTAVVHPAARTAVTRSSSARTARR